MDFAGVRELRRGDGGMRGMASFSYTSMQK